MLLGALTLAAAGAVTLSLVRPPAMDLRTTGAPGTGQPTDLAVTLPALTPAAAAAQVAAASEATGGALRLGFGR